LTTFDRALKRRQMGSSADGLHGGFTFFGFVASAQKRRDDLWQSSGHLRGQALNGRVHPK
jgi:hypothetical protein